MEYKWAVLSVTTTGVFMAMLDSSIVIVGLPTVLKELHATMGEGIWIITGYRLMIAALLLSLGKVADRIGRVRLFTLGFAVFTAGSALCALSSSGTQLNAFRLVQGLGGALLFVNSIAIVTATFSHRELGTAIGINQMAVNAGTIVGYTLSGILIEAFGWRSIFLVNIPIGAFGTYWSHKRLRETKLVEGKMRFDYVGTSLFISGLSALLLGMSIEDFRSPLVQRLVLAGVALLILFVLVERKVSNPLVDLGLFKNREFSMGNISNLLNMLALQSVAFIISLYFQVARGYGPFEAGLALIPFNLSVLVLSPVSGRLSDIWGPRRPATIGLLISCVAYGYLSLIDRHTPYVLIASGLAIVGLGTALFRSPNTSAIMSSVPRRLLGSGSGILSTLAVAGSVASIPLSVSVMETQMTYAELSRIVSGEEPVGNDLGQFFSATRAAFVFFAILTLVAIVPSFLRARRHH